MKKNSNTSLLYIIPSSVKKRMYLFNATIQQSSIAIQQLNGDSSFSLLNRKDRTNLRVQESLNSSTAACNIINKKHGKSFQTICKIQLIFSLFLASSLLSFSQTSVTDSLRQQFSRYTANTLQEKLFVHTDKAFYVAGEIVWFKVYNVDAGSHKLQDISKVSYAELINKENKPVLQAKIKLQNGTGSGSFLLPFSVASGSYKLRAYTSWMQNRSPDLYFEKDITIVNSLKKPDWQSANDSAVYNVQFFPEGGNLVYGLQSTVAFKVVNQYGRGIDCSGFLLNQSNDTIIRFKPFRSGMGTFVFTPATGNTYKAVVKVNAKIIISQLPPVYAQGYAMHLQPADSNHLSVTVNTNINNPVSYVYLFVHNGQTANIADAKALSNGKAVFTIDKNVLEEGISHITLFNDAHQPVCERLYFKQPTPQLTIEATANEAIYGTRKKVQLAISTPQQAANLSLSVLLTDSLQAAEQTNIYNYLWLGSEIKGLIEDPGYYFTATGAAAEQAADNLMLTQGWRRFNWEEALHHQTPAFRFLPEYEGQVISGKITDKRFNTPVKNTLVYLSAPGEKFQFNTAASDEQGNIRFVMNDFYGTNGLILQTGNETDSSYQISINNPFSDLHSSTAFQLFNLPERWSAQLTQHSIGTQLQNVYLPEERQHYFFPPDVDTLPFYGKPDKQYLLDDYTRFPTMEEVMREYVTEVRVRKQQEQYHYSVSNSLYSDYFKTDPLVLLDGVPVWNIRKIIDFNPLQVQKLQVVTHKYFLGSQVYSGIVSYATYKGDLSGFQLNPGAIEIDYDGLQLQRQFYSPAYETAQQLGSRIPDFRNVLYWSPEIITDAQGKQTVEFYTSDLPGSYAVVVQGISAMGIAGSTIMHIEVKK